MLLIFSSNGYDFINKKRVVQHFREIGLIPKSAKNIFVRDNHGGFHGDGLTFLTFKVSDNKPNFWMKNPHPFWLKDASWKSLPFQENGVQSLYDSVIRELIIPKEIRPDLQSKSLLYFIYERNTQDIYIVDEQKKRYWYLNVTT